MTWMALGPNPLYFFKDSYDLSAVLIHANVMEKKHTELRELTCPQDDD